MQKLISKWVIIGNNSDKSENVFVKYLCSIFFNRNQVGFKNLKYSTMRFKNLITKENLQYAFLKK